MNRTKQVASFAWRQSKVLALQTKKTRLSLFCDMMLCFKKYRMWTNQYTAEHFWAKSSEERKQIGEEYLQKNIVRDTWQEDFRKNREFFIKYGSVKYEKASLRKRRNDAYMKRYQTGENLIVEYDVHLSRQHYLEGSLTIGKRVLLSKHVFIDYSGELIIHDDVHISADVAIETHSHPGFTSTTSGVAKKERLEIFDHVNLGTRATITESCHKIGRYAKIGAGAVVRGNVPPYAIVIGNPAKIIGFLFSPEDMVEFEKDKYFENERTPLDKYTQYYDKYFRGRSKEITPYMKL